MYKIILASKSEVRKDILEKNNIECNVVHSNVDEDPVKDSLIAKGANPETISKNLALESNFAASSIAAAPPACLSNLTIGGNSISITCVQ